MSPCAARRRRRSRAGGILLQVVARGVHRAADRDLAVLAEHHLHARVGAADGAELKPPGPFAVTAPQVSVMP